MADKRRCHRINVELPITFKFSEKQKNISLATSVDISALGLRLLTKESLSIDQVILLNIKVGKKENFLIKAKVMWIEEKSILSFKEFLIGVKIIDSMDCDEAKFLKFFATKMIDSFVLKT